MTLLAIAWGNVGVQAGYLILALSLLVILHELGHFIPAKLFGCRVEKFFLFFDPWFALFKKKVGETVYGIGWLPLDGYVKIAGMNDESMDKEAMKQPPQEWEFRSKPAWQRLIIMIGGVTVNVLLAFIIYAMILFVWGETKLPTENVKTGISITDSLMYDIGLRDGDKILAVNGEEVKYFDDAAKKILVGEQVTIERNGKVQTIQLPEKLLGMLIEKKRNRVPLFSVRTPVYVADKPDDTTFAAKAGLKTLDKIIAVDSVATPFFDDFKKQLLDHKSQQVTLSVVRGRDTLALHSNIGSDGKIGFYPWLSAEQMDSLGIIKLQKKSYGFFEAIPAGVSLALDNLKFYIDQFKKILSPKTGAYKGVGGFKSIGSIMPKQWGDWETFWSITAFLSIILAFMNLLPIPALDGGHVLFLLYEMITRRKPSEKFLEYAQIAGMVILIGLMLYANGNDWFGWGRGR